MCVSRYEEVVKKHNLNRSERLKMLDDLEDVHNKIMKAIDDFSGKNCKKTNKSNVKNG